MAALARLLPHGQLGQLRLIISPRTLLRWHSHLVQRHWTYPRRTRGRPRAAKPVRALVLQMARDKSGLGLPQIGEPRTSEFAGMSRCGRHQRGDLTCPASRSSSST
jgi:hypothetical protein